MPIAVLILGLLTVIYTYKGGMKAVVWTELSRRAIYLSGGVGGAADPRPSGAGRLVGDLVGRERRGQDARARLHVHAVEPAHRVGGADRRRVPRHGVARHRSAHRAAADVVADRSRTRSARSSARASSCSVQFFLFLCIGLGLWAFYQRARLPAPPTRSSRRSSSSTCRRARGADRRGDRRRDDEHALGRDQLARRRDDARHLSAAQRRARRRSADAADGPAVRARLGRRAHARRPALPAGHEDARRRRRARHRVVHVRRPARRVLPGYLLASRHPARRDPRHVGRDRHDGVHRVREADLAAYPSLRPRSAPFAAHRVALVRPHRHRHHSCRRHALVA